MAYQADIQRLNISIQQGKQLFKEKKLTDEQVKQPRSNNPVRKLPVPGNSVDFVEAVFRLENFRIFSDDFRLVPARKHRKLTGIHRKKYGQFPAGVLLPRSSDFRCFPAGSRGIRWPESSTWVFFLKKLKMVSAL